MGPQLPQPEWHLYDAGMQPEVPLEISTTTTKRTSASTSEKLDSSPAEVEADNVWRCMVEDVVRSPSQAGACLPKHNLDTNQYGVSCPVDQLPVQSQLALDESPTGLLLKKSE